MKNKSKGIIGEKKAGEYLENQGYEILEKNYQQGMAEIDLIALKDNKLLVFVEVKARKNSSFGEPETFVSESQQKRIVKLAEEYIYGINWQGDIRFDIIAIKDNEQPLHIQDAFY
ncbi:MAG: YraN family protein [Bacteroidota bacterium]